MWTRSCDSLTEPTRGARALRRHDGRGRSRSIARTGRSGFLGLAIGSLGLGLPCPSSSSSNSSSPGTSSVPSVSVLVEVRHALVPLLCWWPLRFGRPGTGTDGALISRLLGARRPSCGPGRIAPGQFSRRVPSTRVASAREMPLHALRIDRTARPARPTDAVSSPQAARTGRSPKTSASAPVVAIATARAPLTRASRMATTRPSILPGVRCWKSVWLGTTKVTLARPIARGQGQGQRQAARRRRGRRARSPRAVKAAMIAGPFGRRVGQAAQDDAAARRAPRPSPSRRTRRRWGRPCCRAAARRRAAARAPSGRPGRTRRWPPGRWWRSRTVSVRRKRQPCDHLGPDRGARIAAAARSPRLAGALGRAGPRTSAGSRPPRPAPPRPGSSPRRARRPGPATSPGTPRTARPGRSRPGR